MDGGILVDIIIVLLALGYAINGLRQGLIVGILSFIGFFAGSVIGLQLAPPAVEITEAPLARVIIALVVVFGLAMLGQWATSVIGFRLRHHIKDQKLRRVDEVGGALVSVTAVLAVAWMVAAPLASSGLPGVASAVRNSAILGAIDDNMPDSVRGVYNSLRDSVNTTNFPDIFPGLAPTDVSPVNPPDPELARSPVVQQAQVSVLKVVGNAPQCDRHIEGSSFVYADELVMTNAHVVAGTDNVAVETEQGTLGARVIVFDDSRDLAVLYVPGLNAPALPLANTSATSGQDTIVLGYPQGGPYTASPSRIREERTITGPDIYAENDVRRNVYALRAEVRSGNSGGPLLTTDGTVIGVVFAAAVDDPQTGYALTLEEAQPVMELGKTTTKAVETSTCT